MNQVVEQVVSGVATALTLPARIASRAASPFVRLARLAMVRSRTRGSIPPSTQFDGAVHVIGRARLELGEQCRLGRDVHIETGPSGSIRIGRNVRFSAGVHIVSYASIRIGDDCLIGEYVSIRDANHGMSPGCPYRQQPHQSESISIGSNVWIGRGSVVLLGVTIGDNAVIGANSVITRDVAPNQLVAGAPARLIRTLEPAFESPSATLEVNHGST